MQKINWQVCRGAFLAIIGSLSLSVAAWADIAAVSSRVSPGYEREHLADGSTKPQTYAFANGGVRDVAIAGSALEKVRFIDIAHLLAPELAKQSFVPTRDKQSADLLIFVSWGGTKGTNDGGVDPVYDNVRSGAIEIKNAQTRDDQLAAAERSDSYLAQLNMLDRQRLGRDVENAKILGFDRDLVKTIDLSFTSMAQDLRDDLEANRYFVVLQAFDFKLAQKEKKKKLLWETRFSVRSSNTDFADQLPAMVKYAGHFFGENSGGLIRRPLPNVKVDVGDAVVVPDSQTK